jgi:hypothetical protein
VKTTVVVMFENPNCSNDMSDWEKDLPACGDGDLSKIKESKFCLLASIDSGGVCGD